MIPAQERVSHFRSDIEGLRAIAVLGVLVFHAGVPHVGGGFVGVDVFYVISGFLITQLMLRDVAGPRRTLGQFLSEFYARRVRRILPAATLVMVATLVGAAVVHNVIENAGLISDARSTTLFFSNIHFANTAADYFSAGKSPSPYLQYWSLSLEEQFYVVWPIVFFGLCAVSRSRTALVTGLLVVIGGSFMLNLLWMRSAPISAFYLLPARAWELGCGALLAVFEPRARNLGNGTRAWIGASGLALIIASMVLFTEKTSFPGWYAALPTVGTSFALAAGCGGSGHVQRLLSVRPMQLLGRYSFSLYLWHWPFLVLKVEHFKWLYSTWEVRTASMFVTSLIAAALTYHFIENPLRRARALRVHPARSLALGVMLVGAGLACVQLFQGRSHDLSTSRRVATTNGTLANDVHPTDFVPANLTPPLADSGDRDYVHCGQPCIVGPTTRHRRIVIFGNSHAGHWAPAFENAGEELDARIEIHAPGGCASFLIPVDDLPTGDKAACEQRRQEVFGSFDADPPDLVVLSNMTLDVFEKHPDDWERGVREAIRRIPKQTTVVVFSETPKGNVWVPLCLAENLERADRCDQVWPEQINHRLASIATEEHATYVDLRPLFCTAARCPAITEDTLIYGDTDHLTVPFARGRARWIGAMFGSLVRR